jgi:hypothetical protein
MDYRGEPATGGVLTTSAREWDITNIETERHGREKGDERKRWTGGKR